MKVTAFKLISCPEQWLVSFQEVFNSSDRETHLTTRQVTSRHKGYEISTIKSTPVILEMPPIAIGHITIDRAFANSKILSCLTNSHQLLHFTPPTVVLYHIWHAMANRGKLIVAKNRRVLYIVVVSFIRIIVYVYEGSFLGIVSLPRCAKI